MLYIAFICIILAMILSTGKNVSRLLSTKIKEFKHTIIFLKFHAEIYFLSLSKTLNL